MRLEKEFKYKTEEYLIFKEKAENLINKINEMKYEGYIKDTLLIKKYIKRYERYLSNATNANLSKIIMQEYLLNLLENKYYEINDKSRGR